MCLSPLAVCHDGVWIQLSSARAMCYTVRATYRHAHRLFLIPHETDLLVFHVGRSWKVSDGGNQPFSMWDRTQGCNMCALSRLIGSSTKKSGRLAAVRALPIRRMFLCPWKNGVKIVILIFHRIFPYTYKYCFQKHTMNGMKPLLPKKGKHGTLRKKTTQAFMGCLPCWCAWFRWLLVALTSQDVCEPFICRAMRTYR